MRFSPFKCICAVAALIVVVFLLRVEQPESMMESLNLISFPNDSSVNPLTTSTQGSAQDEMAYDPFLNPLGIPPGKAQNLPSIRVLDSAKERKRDHQNSMYGGTFCSVVM
jgi:hypothetical protein